MQLSVEQRNWSVLAHFSASVCMFLLPSFGWIAPGLIWLFKRQDAEVRFQAGQAFLFQVGMTVGVLAISALGTALSCFLFGALTWLAALIPWFLGIAVPMIAGTRVNNGDDGYRYPITGDWLRQPATL